MLLRLQLQGHSVFLILMLFVMHIPCVFGNLRRSPGIPPDSAGDDDNDDDARVDPCGIRLLRDKLLNETGLEHLVLQNYPSRGTDTLWPVDPAAHDTVHTIIDAIEMYRPFDESSDVEMLQAGSPVDKAQALGKLDVDVPLELIMVADDVSSNKTLPGESSEGKCNRTVQVAPRFGVDVDGGLSYVPQDSYMTSREKWNNSAHGHHVSSLDAVEEWSAAAAHTSSEWNSAQRLSGCHAGCWRCPKQRETIRISLKNSRFTVRMWPISASGGGSMTNFRYRPWTSKRDQQFEWAPNTVFFEYTNTNNRGRFVGDDNVHLRYTWTNRILHCRVIPITTLICSYLYHDVNIDVRKTICVQDINECSSNPCSQHCHNTPGSFHCSCDHDHILDPENQRHCHSCRCSPGWERPTPCVAASLPLPSCQQCQAGRFKTTNNSGPCTACESCAPGQERLSCGGSVPGACSNCSAGRFKPDSGEWNSMCIECSECLAPSTVKVSCAQTSPGECATLKILSPTCGIGSCSEWWAGQPAEVGLSTSLPLCTGAACSTITVELRRASTSGDDELVDVIASALANSTAKEYKWLYVPSKVMPVGHTYFVMVKIDPPEGHPRMSTTMRSDDFIIHDLAEWFAAELLRAADESESGDDKAALLMTKHLCKYPWNFTAASNITADTAANGSSRLQHDWGNKVHSLREVACARANMLANGGDFYGLQSNQVPALQRSSFQGYSVASRALLEVLREAESLLHRNEVLKAWRSLQDQQRKGVEVTTDVLTREMRQSSLQTLQENYATRKKGLQKEIKAKEQVIDEAALKITHIIEQRRVLSDHISEGLLQIGYDVRSYEDVATKRLTQLQKDLDDAIAEWKREMENAKKKRKLLGTIKGGLKVVTGVIMGIKGINAGYYLAAQGAMEVFAAQKEMDVPDVDLIEKGATEETTNETTAFLTDLGSDLAANRTEGVLYDAGHFLQDDVSPFAKQLMSTFQTTEKQKKQAQLANDIIDMAGGVLEKVYGVDIPEKPQIEEFLVQIGEQRMILAVLRGIEVALRPAAEGAQLLEQHFFGIVYGMSPPVQFAVAVKANMLMAGLEHFLYTMRRDTKLNEGKKVNLFTQEKRIRTAIEGALDLDVSYWEESTYLQACVREKARLKEEMAELDNRTEELRQERLGRDSLDVKSAAHGHSLAARIEAEDAPLRQSLIMDIRDVLRKQELALSYWCLDDVTRLKLNLRGASTYSSLQAAQASLELLEVRCLERRAEQRPHTAPHMYVLTDSNDRVALAQLRSNHELRFCIPSPTSTGSNFYHDARVGSLEVYLMSISGRHTPKIVLTRTGPSIIVTPRGEVKSFLTGNRQWLFQYDTVHCAPQSAMHSEGKEDDFSEVSPYGCYFLKVLGLKGQSLEEVHEVRIVFHVLAKVKTNDASFDEPRLFEDASPRIWGRPGEGCNGAELDPVRSEIASCIGWSPIASVSETTSTSSSTSTSSTTTTTTTSASSPASFTSSSTSTVSSVSMSSSSSSSSSTSTASSLSMSSSTSSSSSTLSSLSMSSSTSTSTSTMSSLSMSSSSTTNSSTSTMSSTSMSSSSTSTMSSVSMSSSSTLSSNRSTMSSTSVSSSSTSTMSSASMSSSSSSSSSTSTMSSVSLSSLSTSSSSTSTVSSSRMSSSSSGSSSSTTSLSSSSSTTSTSTMPLTCEALFGEQQADNPGRLLFCNTLSNVQGCLSAIQCCAWDVQEQRWTHYRPPQVCITDLEHQPQ